MVQGRLDTTFYKSLKQSTIIFLNHADWMFFIYQVWSSTKGHEVASLPGSGPMNCVTFDPEDRLLAAGCWNGNVIIWNWLQNKTQAVSYCEGRPKKVMWVFLRTHMLALFDSVRLSMSGQHNWDLPFHFTRAARLEGAVGHTSSLHSTVEEKHLTKAPLTRHSSLEFKSNLWPFAACYLLSLFLLTLM